MGFAPPRTADEECGSFHPGAAEELWVWPPPIAGVEAWDRQLPEAGGRCGLRPLLLREGRCRLAPSEIVEAWARPLLKLASRLGHCFYF